MLGALAAYHASRYEGRGGSTAFRTAAVRAFHEAATQDALERGWLRTYALRLDGASRVSTASITATGSTFISRRRRAFRRSESACC